jgi:UDP-2-acetamido-2-deoxy-ribo-hexuluronate aminotransferase
MKINFNDLKFQNKIIKKKIYKNFEKIFNHSNYIFGPEIEALEKKLNFFCNTKYCIATSSGTDALLISLMALNLKSTDEVITTPFTYIATAEVILRVGARPVFADINPATGNIDPVSIKKKINKKTKAIIAVSLFGQTANIEAIKKIAKNIIIIEDASQSFGATHNNKKSCSLADIGCTSFFPSKILGCYGDGGAIFTNNKKLSGRFIKIRKHGQGSKYNYEILGINARLDTMQAAVLLEKIKLLNLEIKKRNNIYNLYKKKLTDIKEISLLKIEENNYSNCSIFSILVKKNRLKLINFLKKKGIPTVIYYPKPLNYFPIFKKYSSVSSTPNALKMSKLILSLPISPYMKEKSINYITATIKNFYSK